ncbi:stalk domain-containing protein [Brevibacillus brevis]|uniref:stalk domain-containing protein n=1 Tax=Brevibacillus brevis TaxID=1393 RepID=UPI00064F72DE|nr:stalk domain-containing protein [Brevibacillus brevis]
MKKSNKKLAIGLATVLLLVGATTVFAKTGTEKISARFSNIKLIVNDQVVKTKAEPLIYNGNVYAPVATVANALGIKQEWDNKTVRFSVIAVAPAGLLMAAPFQKQLSNRPKKHYRFLVTLRT